MPEDSPENRPYNRFFSKFFSIIDGPATLFREKVVEPFHGKHKNYYYHRRFRRVPTIDECEVNEETCFYEANEQFKRDKAVDSEVLNILRQRRLECEFYYAADAERYCQKQSDDYTEAETNWFVKYGDLGAAGNVVHAYMKQKHRLIWERRHGPVGTGMKKKQSEELLAD